MSSYLGIVTPAFSQAWINADPAVGAINTILSAGTAVKPTLY